MVVHGLVEAAELNIRTETIVRWMAGKGRYQVDLDGRPNAIKPGNLKLVLSCNKSTPTTPHPMRCLHTEPSGSGAAPNKTYQWEEHAS